MRVITGSARGKRLKSLPGNDVRPTTEKVKEAIFSAIQFDIEGRRFLDLFAGSGQMGIEALSRGASGAVFVDAATDSIKVCTENVKSAGFENRARIVRSDAFSYLAGCGETFDIAFLDPPYKAGLLIKAVGEVARRMSDFGTIICEHPTELALPDTVEDFSVYRTYRYGKIQVSIYKKER